jgi:hypothetical protein
MTTYGTACFVSKAKAARYYYSQGYGESYAEAAFIVNDKLAAGEIKIGKPKVRESETLSIIDNGTRYAVEGC